MFSAKDRNRRGIIQKAKKKSLQKKREKSVIFFKKKKGGEEKAILELLYSRVLSPYKSGSSKQEIVSLKHVSPRTKTKQKYEKNN